MQLMITVLLYWNNEDKNYGHWMILNSKGQHMHIKLQWALHKSLTKYNSEISINYKQIFHSALLQLFQSFQSMTVKSE